MLPAPPPAHRISIPLISADRELNPLRVKPGAAFSVVVRSQFNIYRVDEIRIDVDSSRWDMHDFKIGAWSLGQQARGLVLESFSKVDFMSVLRFPPCQIGMCFVMVVEYVDTIQTLVCEHADGRPGGPAQLRACMKRLTDYQMTTGTTLWLVSQLTRRGELAGSVTGAHHFADVVLRLDQEDDARILSSSKNRFGSVHDGALFKLTAKGFVEYAAS